jgi:hypothetical protein
MLLFPQEIIILIIDHMCSRSVGDANNLTNLALTCARIRHIMNTNFDIIMKIYIYTGRYYLPHYQSYYYSGKLHSFNDMPAVTLRPDIRPIGLFSKRQFRRQWYKHGKLHRDNDKPAIISNTGSMSWYQNGKLHRDNLPAYISRYGSKFYYFQGKLHREDGPAIIYSDGELVWYRHGKWYKSIRLGGLE